MSNEQWSTDPELNRALQEDAEKLRSLGGDPGEPMTDPRLLEPAWTEHYEHARGCPGLQSWDIPAACNCEFPVVRRCIAKGHRMARTSDVCRRCVKENPND